MIKAGMNPIDAIKSAAIHAADNIGFGNHIGSVEPGKLADIIAVRGDPLADIDALLQVAFVMKDGSIQKFDNI